jgi:hypothetical protein
VALSVNGGKRGVIVITLRNAPGGVSHRGHPLTYPQTRRYNKNMNPGTVVSTPKHRDLLWVVTAHNIIVVETSTGISFESKHATAESLQREVDNGILVVVG